MSRVKSLKVKIKLGKAMKKNRRVPLFVTAKTKRKVRSNPLQRNWRKSKLDIKEE